MTALLIGSRLERYQVVSELGRGGMSVVYCAKDLQLQRQVALKVLHPHLAQLPEARERFRREAVAVARLHHPHIIEIYDYSAATTAATYLVMERVDGVALSHMLQGGALLPEAVMLLARTIVDALAAAHEAGVIHRDLKPENILVAPDGTLKLTDFGIARILDNQTMTLTGALLGSPAYMAPEYIDGGQCDARADLFSVGAMLYQMAVGQLPFDAPSPHAVLKKIAGGSYVPAEQANPHIHADMGHILRRCLATRPDDRYPSAAALLHAIDAFLQPLKLDPLTQRGLFLRDPQGYAQASIQPLAARYTELGKAALAAKQTGRALAHFDRVLSLTPGDVAVRRTLRRMARRFQVVRGAKLLAAAAAIGLLAVAAYPRLYGPAAPAPSVATLQPPQKPAFEDLPPKPAEPKPVPEPHVRRLPAAKVPASQPKPPPPAARPAAKSRRVEFKPAGQWVTLFVDNSPTPFVEGAMRTFEVPLSYGRHSLRFTNDKAQPLETEILVDDRETRPVLVRLHPLDAKLRIHGAPDGSVVEVAQRRFVLNERTRDDPMFVPLPQGRGSQSYEVVIHSPDNAQEYARRHLTFRPGEEQSLAIPAQPY